MTDRISIPALRESADRGVYVIGRDKLLALVQAVEAAQHQIALSAETDGAISDWLIAALARFDFGEET